MLGQHSHTSSKDILCWTPVYCSYIRSLASIQQVMWYTCMPSIHDCGNVIFLLEYWWTAGISNCDLIGSTLSACTCKCITTILSHSQHPPSSWYKPACVITDTKAVCSYCVGLKEAINNGGSYRVYDRW